MRGLNEQLERGQAAPIEAAATPSKDSGEAGRLQGELGSDVNVSYRGNRLSIGVNDSVTFDSGSTTLKDSSHKVLKNVASALKGQYAGRRLYIEGHTDDDPIQKTKDKFRSNRHLSVERADAVARFLIAQGVPESKIVIVGFGQFDPSANSKSKAQNRRVEIVIGDPAP